jgi:TolB-like protein/tetratricopeptide (TPR) repeat protein
MSPSPPPRRSSNAVSIALFVSTAALLAYLAAEKLWFSKPASAPLLMQSPTVAESTPAAAAPAFTPPVHSVAVLPFFDMSEKQDQEYFSDGMSAELIDSLTKIPDLQVTARTSSFYFKGKSTTVADIAKALNVLYVLEGSVRKTGTTLGITAQLIRADNGHNVWSETYDQRLDDVFRVQDEIAGAVVRVLKISPRGGSVPASTGTQNVEAYNLYLQAISVHKQPNERAEDERILDYLHRALNFDSRFANAWALLSGVLVDESELAAIEGGVPADQVKEEARRAAKQALDLNPGLPESHLALANILMTYDLDVRGANAQVQQALELNPNNSMSLVWAAKQAAMKGQFDNAIQFLQKSIAIDPVNVLKYYDLSWTLYSAGRFPEALAANRKTLDLNNGAREDYYYQATLVSLAKGDPAGALAKIESDEKLRERCGCQVLAYDALGRKIEADAALARWEKNHADTFAYPIGRVYASRGELDQAFRWFERAYRQRETTLWWIKVDPLLKNVQADPRFEVFLRKMNLLD